MTLDALQEVHTLLDEIRQAWRDVPNLLPSVEQPASGVSMVMQCIDAFALKSAR
jgi:flagellin-specific chaperone FliS